ncbi:hypothetical protein [Streptomyces uncialis]|uniref:hypothetical protein n=1 Tax=Streptomyces uncialis TaxID=1048205 RepID=UPI002258F624|nr:hypothetical protein [Streptomyces uncialis]MCX4663400.1 hypothetical protein [Streptomyces uncialis]
MSWPIREPVAGETTVTTDASGRLRVIEVRIRGVRETAVEQAVTTLDTLAQNAELSLHCRDATLVERVQRPQIEWRLRGRRRPLSRRISYRLKFWDPAANQHTSIRLEDARIKVVPDSDSACAKAAR